MNSCRRSLSKKKISASHCKDHDKLLQILLIGTLPPPIGGISVSFHILVDLLNQRQDVKIEILDLGELRRDRGLHIFQSILFVRRLLFLVRKVDVVTLYAASTALPSLGLIILFISRILDRPFVLRKAAGFDYLDLGFFLGSMAHFVVKHSTLYLAQTQNLVSLALKRGVAHVKWYPTSRPMPDHTNNSFFERRACRRFIFVGQVRKYKGVLELIDAAERFDKSICVDIYGPIFDDFNPGIFAGLETVAYRGVLSAEDVIPTMKQYDMLLLPTKANTEGYPGVVFEGYSAGLPIITTRCGGIPEIVDETCGIFVEPGNSDALFEAMKKVIENDIIFRKLQKGVLEMQNQFDSNFWADRFVDYCREALDAHVLKRKS